MMHNVGRYCTADPTSGDPVLKLFPEVEGEARRSLWPSLCEKRPTSFSFCGVATVSSIDKIIGLLCKRAL